MKISLHAISRYRERSNTPEGTDEEIIDKIHQALATSRLVQLRSKKERVSKLLTHGAGATYHQSGAEVFVRVGDTVVSAYMYFRDRWMPVKESTL
jgi:hypothetical protein